MGQRTILVTGGTGFIGRHVKAHFIKKYAVFAPLRSELDLLDTASVEDYIKKRGIDVVVHAAAVGVIRNESGPADLETNLRMFFNVLRSAPHYKKLVHLGSGAEYDKARPLVRVKESEFGKRIPSGNYDFYKYVCGKYLENMRNVVNLIFFGVFGPYEDYRYRFISYAITRNLLKLPIVIQKDTVFDYLPVDDAVRIIDYFVDHDTRFSRYNVGSGRPLNLSTIAEVINRVSDHPSPIVIKKPGLANEYTCTITRLQREIPGLEMSPLEDAIKNLYAWYKKNMRLIDKRLLL